MSVSKFMKSGGWAAMAVALATSVVPAEASAQGRRGGDATEQDSGAHDRVASERSNAMEIRGRRVQEANAARTRQAEPRATQAEPSTARVSRQADQSVAQATRQNTLQGTRQGDRRTDQATRQVERRGEQGDRQVQQRNWQGTRQADRRTDQATRRVEQGGDQTARQVQQRDWQARQGERTRAYTDQTRNRSYTARNGDSNRRDNDRDNSNWQNRRDNDRNNDRSRNNWQRDRRDNDWSNRDWDRRWRDNNRYDWQRYRNTNRAAYRLGTYYAPYQSYSYRRYGIGNSLGSLFYGSSYWITNPWQYRLPDVWGPYRWVRYYDDVMLVDVYTGQVVDVIYDFFW